MLPVWILCSTVVMNLQAYPSEISLPLLAQITNFTPAHSTHQTAPPTPPMEQPVRYQIIKPTPTQEDSFNWPRTTRDKNQDPLSSFLLLQETFPWNLTNGRFLILSAPNTNREKCLSRKNNFQPSSIAINVIK